MSLTLNDFLTTLFDAGEATCFVDNPYGHKVRPVDGDWATYTDNLFFSINPLHLGKDLGASEEWHSPVIGRRADINVTAYRNFLLECDFGSIEEQYTYLNSLEIPYTTLVHSGGKSLHAIVSLEDPVTADQYRVIAARLHKLCTKADPSTKNPSRLSRLPFRVRPETGKMQELLYLGSRIKNADLLARLPEGPKSTQVAFKASPAKLSIDLLSFILQPDEVIRDKNLGGRNRAFFYLGKRLDDMNIVGDKRAEYVETAYSNLKDVSGFSISEAKMAARCK